MKPAIPKRAYHKRVLVNRFRWLILAVVCSCACLAFGQHTSANSTAKANHTAGAAIPRPDLNSPDTAVEVEGLIRLDVEVTGPDAQAHTLERANFTVLDNGLPQKLVAFRAPSPQEPLTVILLIDTFGLPKNLAIFERQEVTKFLRQNEGHLTLPVAIYSLASSGLYLVANPSQEGNALAEKVDSGKPQATLFEPLPASSSFRRAVEEPYTNLPLLVGLRAVGTIAATENDHPGKKLLLWVGPGLLDPLISNNGTGQYPDKDYRLSQQFPSDALLWITTLMRQARVSLYAFSAGENESNPAANAWKSTLATLPTPQTTGTMDIYKKVLAIRTGGRVLPPEKDLAQQIAKCIAEVGSFYSLTFDPPLTTQRDEYHTLEIKLSNPSLTARTVSGYFDQPFYNTSPDIDLRPMTIAELEKFIETPAVIGFREPLSYLRLTERLSDTKLVELKKKVHGNENRASLQSLADLSAFLPPPASELRADPPPDAAAQQKILAATEDYLDHTITRLPNFFATRKTVLYAETAAFQELTVTVKPVPLHVEEQSQATVLYRDGKEVVKVVRRSKAAGLSTYGTFGPLLLTARAAIKSHSNATWSRWEQDPGGRVAVFQFHSSAVRPTIRLNSLSLPYGADITAPYHGEIAVDPATGAILRLQIQSDLQGFVPVGRSNMMVIYGPIEIDGRTYVVPRRSINVMTTRTIPTLEIWNVGFQTWGPFQTRINEFTFDHYHMFRSTSRILPDFTEVRQ